MTTTMTDDDVLAEFRAAEALLEGHFILSSGLLLMGAAAPSASTRRIGSFGLGCL